jgi:hypothetical protein
MMFPPNLTFGVDDEFRMIVPIYLELADGHIVNLGRARLTGNASIGQKVPIKGLKDAPNARSSITTTMSWRPTECARSETGTMIVDSKIPEPKGKLGQPVWRQSCGQLCPPVLSRVVSGILSHQNAHSTLN